MPSTITKIEFMLAKIKSSGEAQAILPGGWRSGERIVKDGLIYEVVGCAEDDSIIVQSTGTHYAI